MDCAYTIKRLDDNRILGYSHHHDSARIIAVALSRCHAETFVIETASTEVARFQNGKRISKPVA